MSNNDEILKLATDYILERLDLLIKVTAAAALVANELPNTKSREVAFSVLRAQLK